MVVKVAERKKQIGEFGRFTRLDAVVTVVILLIVAGAFYYYLAVRNTSNTTNAPIQVNAVSGSLASGFPQNFILESGVSFQNSSVSDYPGGAKFWTASYVSQLSPSDVLGLYSNYFQFMHWIITQASNSSVSGMESSTQINVSAQPGNSGTQVLISVLQK